MACGANTLRSLVRFHSTSGSLSPTKTARGQKFPSSSHPLFCIAPPPVVGGLEPVVVSLGLRTARFVECHARLQHSGDHALKGKYHKRPKKAQCERRSR